MARRIGKQVVTIVHRSRDELTGDVGDTARVDVAGCMVQPTGASENSGRSGGAVQATQRARLYGPEALKVAVADDVIEVPGDLFNSDVPVRMQVEGGAQVWPTRKGGIDHVEIDLTLVTG